jgi:RimJ/RimL family protein N-acetyltransferase
MISLAHPDFRDELFEKAKDLGFMSRGRKLSESLRSVYPVGLEEVRTYDGHTVKFRPAKPVDIRRIQEHFYNLDRSDVVSRFFYEKTAFLRDDVESLVESDYIKNLTILAVTGEFGFGTVVGLGAYMHEPKSNTAEIAFSVSRPWQKKKIASVILHKLVEAAKNNGISGLTAYTAPENRGMVRLFNKLPYKTHSFLDEGMLVLNCRFDEPEEAAGQAS